MFFVRVMVSFFFLTRIHLSARVMVWVRFKIRVRVSVRIMFRVRVVFVEAHKFDIMC